MLTRDKNRQKCNNRGDLTPRSSETEWTVSLPVSASIGQDRLVRVRCPFDPFNLRLLGQMIHKRKFLNSPCKVIDGTRIYVSWPNWVKIVCWWVAKIGPRIPHKNTRLCGTRPKGKGKGLGTCYSAAHMSQTLDQQRFTISEVAADWHEPMVPQRIMWPSIARANEQLILPPRGRSHTILPEYCRPLICACVLNLVRIGCGSPKGCFFRPSKSLQFRLKPCYSLYKTGDI